MSAAPPVTTGLEGLLRTMADDELVIGWSDSEWTGIAPLLEEDVAMSSLAQDELGHATALYGLLADVTFGEADALAFDREFEACRHARLLDHGRGDWAMTIARRYLYETSDAVRLEALAAGSWAPLAELVGKLQREERYHAMHIGTWFERLARSDGAARERLIAALVTLRPDAATVFTPLANEAELVSAGILAAPMMVLETRWRATVEPVVAALGLPPLLPDRAPHDGRTGHGSAFAWLWGEITMVRRSDPGGDMVITVDTLDAVRATLGTIPDPELPMLSIVDLGMIGDVRVDDDGIRVELLPTFVGCPALDRIRTVVGEELASFGRPVAIVTTFAVPWTTDRISSDGRAALRAAGIAPPVPEAELRCPLCDSADVTRDNLFGPTQCRSIHYCRTCRQPFEAMKPI